MMAAPGCARRRLLLPRNGGHWRKARCRSRRNSFFPSWRCGEGWSKRRRRAMSEKNWPLWEVFIRTRNGMAHRHVGSVHAVDAAMALQNARDVYTRRGEGLSVWVVPSAAITASDPDDKDMLFEPTASKIYRHPTFYEIPDEVGHM